MTRPVWPKLVPRSLDAPADPAPDILVQIALAIESRASEVLRGRATASHARPVRGSWAAVDEKDAAHVWHSDAGDGIDVWCVIGNDSVKSLLEFVLGGPGADNPTALERGIVRETIDRMLSTRYRLWEERSRAGFSTSRGWQCRVSIASPSGKGADLALYAPAAEDPPVPIRARVDLRNVPVTLSAALPPVNVSVHAMAEWRLGTIVDLQSGANAAITLFADTVHVGSGSLGTVRGRRALKLGRREAGARV